MKKEICTCPLPNLSGEYLNGLVGRICATYRDTKGINHIEGFNLPSRQEILDVLDKLMEIVFPGFSGVHNYHLETIEYNIGNIINDIYCELIDQVVRSFHYRCTTQNCEDCKIPELSKNAVEALLDAIPNIRETMKLDIAAAYAGDPAAMSIDEIVVSYPGIKAITIQRFAHILYKHDVPLIPRMMTEHAHMITGIDIHPGAQLQKGIFIDHGTGVVIGETAVIGNNVKIYQGVTLGALSFPRDESGEIIKGSKRHPTLEDGVTVYSGATVLGDIVIGKNAVIGGNAWVISNVKPNSQITIRPPEHRVKDKTPKK
jgi:serine O-acetyltransferase